MDMADAGEPDTQRVQLPVTRGPIRMFTIGNIPVTATIELELPVSKSNDLCANHGCGKHGTKLCGGCGELRYCSAECQRVHWKKRGGHKELCKAAQAARIAEADPVKAFIDLATETVAVAAASDGDGAPGECFICLEMDPRPIRTRCLCRGNAGWAHIKCIAEQVDHAEESTGLHQKWWTCVTCHDKFHGAMWIGLVHARWQKAQHLAETDWRRLIPTVAMGSCLSEYGMLDHAEVILRRASTVVTRISPPNDLEGLKVANILARTLANQGKYTEAEAIFRNTHAVHVQTLGPYDESTLDAHTRVASVLREQNKHAEAATIFEVVLSAYKQLHGPEHPNTLSCAFNLILSRTETVNLDAADTANAEYLPIMKRVLGPEHPNTLLMIGNRARGLFLRGRFGDAESILVETLPMMERVCGRESPSTLNVASLLGTVRIFIAQHGSDAPPDWDLEEIAHTVNQKDRLTAAEMTAQNRAR